MSVFALLALIWVIEPPLLGAFAGWLSTRAEAPVRYWAENPWRVFWATFPLVLIGWVLRDFGFLMTGLTLIGVPGALALLSAIQGLRSAWHRSRKRAIVILAVVWGLLIIEALVEALFQEEILPVHKVKLLGGMLSGPMWILAALVAEYVNRRFSVRER